MRLFIAVGADHLPFEASKDLKKLWISLKEKNVEHRLVPKANYHITLAFLGEVDETRLPALKECLRGIQHGSFDLKLRGVGAFPEDKMGRVLHLHVQNSRDLRSLQEKTVEVLKHNDFWIDEKDYVPHLTIGRLRNPKDLRDPLSPYRNTDFDTVQVEKITLYESRSGGSFPVYVPLESYPLN